MTAGRVFRDLLNKSKQPLQIVGTINAMTAKIAEKNQLQAIYLSGAGVANADFALPDLGLVDMADTLQQVKRITQACDLPLLVDIDTGGAQPLTITRWVEGLISAGAAACHLEDQHLLKRCGHREHKHLCSLQEMVMRIQCAVAAKTDPDFFIIARTDAVSVNGLDDAIMRAQAYVEAGADGIFAEAITSIADYQRFTASVDAPILANLTEFGKTPLLSLAEAKQAKLAMLLYPLSAFRMMNKAAELCYATIKQQGTQASLLSHMQTRDELYKLIDYYQAEQIIDDYFESFDGEH